MIVAPDRRSSVAERLLPRVLGMRKKSQTEMFEKVLLQNLQTIFTFGSSTHPIIGVVILFPMPPPSLSPLVAVLERVLNQRVFGD